GVLVPDITDSLDLRFLAITSPPAEFLCQRNRSSTPPRSHVSILHGLQWGQDYERRPGLRWMPVWGYPQSLTASPRRFPARLSQEWHWHQQSKHKTAGTRPGKAPCLPLSA
ncbi:hypothetical protein JMJ77_0006449, partial [Colletotrichum scovillei]